MPPTDAAQEPDVPYDALVEITPNKRKLVSLVEEVQSGAICLPNFQRDFVWARDEVADLVRSVLRGYFVGSLLMLRCDPDKPPFAPMYFRGVNEKPLVTEPAPEWLVLDGQQRLTSLLYALSAPKLGLKNSKNPRRYFVRLDVLANDPESDDVVFELTDRDCKRDGLDDPLVQYREHILPCTKLLYQKDYLAWRDGIDDWLKGNDSVDHDRFRTEWREAWTKGVTAFQSFEVPVVELPRISEDDDIAIGRVCAIFEKLNSTGVALSVYDLLTARLYRDKIDLHQLWDEAVATHPKLAAWSEGSADSHNFGVLMLRTVALLRELEPKPRILINLVAKDFAEDWRRAARAMESALELLTNVSQDGFGVFKEKWLPGYGSLPVLAALRATIDDRGLQASARADLRRWWWCNVFLERYSSSVETKSRRDYVEMLKHWNENGPEPSVFAEAKARIGAEGYSIADSASYASAVYSGVFCLLAIGGARDWAEGETITLQSLEDHHIFPQGYLKANGGLRAQTDKGAMNTILNRTLISDGTNRRITDRAPAVYLQDPKVFSAEPGSLLVQHFVNDTALSAMQDAKASSTAVEVGAAYERFRSVREAAITSQIRGVCGITT